MSKKKKKTSRRYRDEKTVKHTFIHGFSNEKIVSKSISVGPSNDKKPGINSHPTQNRNVNVIGDLKHFLILGAFMAFIVIIAYITTIYTDFKLPLLG